MVALVAFVGMTGASMLERITDEGDRRVTRGSESGDRLIAFVTQGPEDMSPWIAVVPVGGGEVTRLHEGRDPAWSPDGTRIAFGCDRGICTMNPDGSDVRELTDPASPAFDEDPDWGPSGGIAFTRNYFDDRRPRDIVVVGEEGGQQVTITSHDSDDLAPSWSPDGRSIAFIRAQGGPSDAPPGGWDLWTMAATGGAAEMLVDSGGPARPDWSPDGRTIIFDEAAALWTVPASGGEPSKLPVVSGNGFDVGSFPAWAPDSRQIAFMCSSKGRDGNDICMSDVDSEEFTILVATSENEASPAWQPTRHIDQASDPAFDDEADRLDQLTQQQGRVACHDGPGDLLGEGSGDQSGSGPKRPDEDRPGTDLTGFSMGRSTSGSLELNFSTVGRIPEALARGESLHFEITAVPKKGVNGFAALTATLRGDSWIVTAREGEDEPVILNVEPEIAGTVLNLLIEAEDVPHLMRGSFRWHAFSEWAPTGKGSPAFNDYCPDSGFPLFEGTSS
jgi:Tol biopolymer transport system component